MRVNSSDRYASLAQVESLVERFEARTLRSGELDHVARLTVGVWFLMHHAEHEAAARTIDGIRAHNRTHGIRQSSDGGYHETVTLFWLTVTRRFLDGASEAADRLALVNTFVEQLADRKLLIFDFYSRSRLRSWKARQSWIAPDLRSLDSI